MRRGRDGGLCLISVPACGCGEAGFCWPPFWPCQIRAWPTSTQPAPPRWSITSAQGAAASTGVPLTHRGLATGVRYVTGHRAKDATLDLDWASLASEETTLVVYMGAGNIAEIARNLMQHGLPGNLPVLAISSATTPRETRLMSALGRIGADVARVQPDAPVLFVIGHVAGLYPAIAAMDAALCEGAGMAAYA